MDAALELFANKGFHTTTVSDIAKKAGVSKGLMYNYFRSKEELLKEIIMSGVNSTMQFLDKNRDGVLTKEELLYFIKQSLKTIQTNRTLWKLYYTIIYQPAVMSIVEKELYKTYESYVKMVLSYFESQGAEDPVNEMRFLSAMLDGVALGYLMTEMEYPLDKLEEKILKLYS